MGMRKLQTILGFGKDLHGFACLVIFHRFIKNGKHILRSYKSVISTQLVGQAVEEWNKYTIASLLNPQ